MSKIPVKILILAGGLLVGICAGLGIWIYKLDQSITQRLAEKQLIPTIEFYSAPMQFFKGQKLQKNQALQSFERLRYRLRQYGQVLQVGDYAQWTGPQCKEFIPILEDGVQACIAFRNRFRKDRTTFTGDPLQVIAVGEEDIIYNIYSGEPSQAAVVTELEPELFAQFYGNQPIIRRKVELGDTPPLCLNAVVAIEDSHFLEHGGVSFRGIARAAFRDILGRHMEGGSTITQQLVKNYFLTNERTFKRKFKELFMALLLETRASKDDILQSYINEIYMGQDGSFQLRGYGAAAEHYFSKKLEDLNLPECALLASLVNAPGVYDPNKHPDKARQRREMVLKKMREGDIIDEEAFQAANKTPLPAPRKRILSEPAPYFVDAVLKQLEALKIDTSVETGEGVRVFTTLNQDAQEAAQVAVRTGIAELETQNKNVMKLKAAGKLLEGLLISSDPLTGFVRAAVGGRSFRMSQFNRVTQGHRQVGSIMKPLVYLSALGHQSPDGKLYNPLTIVDDSRMKISYEGQKWSPENYTNRYFGEIPLFFALKESLNCATVKVAMDAGLKDIVDLAQKAGVSSDLKPLPSLALGSFELFPWEVLQIYQTFSRFGDFVPLTFVERVESIAGRALYIHEAKHEQRLDAISTAILVGMMKLVMSNGTGKSAILRGFTHPAAGKTGTTSDYRDSWFAGFTPLHAAVAWVGYDDNTDDELTGASGALPIWTNYMKQFSMSFPPIDFKWPEGTKTIELDKTAQAQMNVPDEPRHPIEPVTLVIRAD